MSAQTTLLPRISLPIAKSRVGAYPKVDVYPKVVRAPVSVEKVTSRQDLKAFIDFPKQLYKNDPQWVAPLDLQVKDFLNRRKHPFYKHGEAQAFLAKRDGKTVGRILASDDSRYNELHNTNVGCFGMFESINDQRACRTLLDTAARWLMDRGRTELLGPIDYSTNYPCGLLVDGFSTSPSVMMNHNPHYYQSLLHSYGLTKAKDLYAWWFDRENEMDSTWRERIERLTERHKVTVRSIEFRNFDAEVARCKEIYNQSFEENWGFVKMTDAEFDHLAKDLRQMAVPELIQIAEVDGYPVGLSIALPNLNEAAKPLGGKLTTAGLPIGLFRLMHRLKRVRSCRFVVLGVLPGYRRRGVAEALIERTFDNSFGKLGYNSAELGWTLEDNVLVNRMIERVGGRRYKTYRIFSKAI